MANKYTAYFEKYLGRPLYRWERDVIAPLEYIRQHGSKHRVVVVDPPGYDSRQLLCHYIHFLHKCIAPYADYLVMARTRKEARRLCGNATDARFPWLYTASVRRPDSIRGLTFHFALLLDTDRRHIDDALSAVAPVILNEGRNNFIIIHTRSSSLRTPPAYIHDPEAPKTHTRNHTPAPYVILIDSDRPPDTMIEEPPEAVVETNPGKLRPLR